MSYIINASYIVAVIIGGLNIHDWITKHPKFKEAIKSKLGIALIISLILSAILTFIPWGDIHIGKPQVKIVYKDRPSDIKKEGEKKDTSVQHKIAPISKPVRRHSSVIVNNAIRQSATQQPMVKPTPTQDNSIAVDNSPGSHNVGGSNNNVGVNGDVYGGVKQRHVSQADLNSLTSVLSKVKNKTVLFDIKVGENGSETPETRKLKGEYMYYVQKLGFTPDGNSISSNDDPENNGTVKYSIDNNGQLTIIIHPSKIIYY